MKIYLFLSDRVVSFTLPKKMFGSYAFDANPDEESKLINIEIKNDSWVLYSTDDVEVLFDGKAAKNVTLLPGYYYVLRRDGVSYPIFVTKGFEDNLSFYHIEDNFSMIIGKTDECNFKFNCPFFDKIGFIIKKDSNNIIIQKEKTSRVYCNDLIIPTESYYVNNGDKISYYGIKIIFFNGFLLLNSLSGLTFFHPEEVGLKECALTQQEEKKDIQVKDEDLYKPEDYFSKSPRLRRLITTKDITLSPPPQNNDQDEMPILLTVGPMLTMAMMLVPNASRAVTGLIAGTDDISTAWPQLVTAFVMLFSIIMWPSLTKKFQKRLKKRKKQNVIEKYTEYLQIKRKELENERELQKSILIENVIPLDACLNNINIGRLNFWSKRVEQNDFLTVRLGMGNELLDVKVNYPESGFSIDQDELRVKADQMVEDYKYIENVPVGYSFATCRITGLMGSEKKQYGLIDNIILQLISFYSYDDIKFVIFTNSEHEKRWSYMKYLNHTFSNTKDIRFFSSNYDSAMHLNEYLNAELQQRIALLKENEERIFKPHYIIITDDYSQIKTLSFIKNFVEIDYSLGFSLIIMENTMSKLPSKCNNFISLGEHGSGILRNSYEQQEQQPFKDEIKYNVNMMDVVQKIANVPVEFLDGNYVLPDMITFLEMEKVGKVEQLNIIDRWNLNDSTQSLKAEVGLDSSGNLMYLDLHEKYHGPHGLIAGMTGSGKSEFIITYILSMAINYSPDDVAFILIDYKGGGLAFAFENKTTGMVLPHLAGTITNLDKAEMNRTLVSIDSEVKRRQQLFNEARDKMGESTIDIYKYQGFYHEGKLSEPLPHLFIICDEFAELKAQQPDFMDNLISVARIGRSLGVHLILATQKPSGVVNDQIWSNTKFRVCLKVQDASDSKEMLKRPDAAELKQTGRFYLQVGYDEYFALGQSGWAGAKYFPSEKIIKQVDKSVNVIDNTGDFIKNIQASSGSAKVQAQGEQLAAILGNIIDVANRENKRTRKLWLENIPNMIYYSDVLKKYHTEFDPNVLNVVVGEYDAPEIQKQGVLNLNMKEMDNILVYGNDGEEKEKFLNALLYSFVNQYSPEDINIYAVDYGSESLRMFSQFPQIGGFVFSGEDEKFKNSIKLITEEIRNRKKLFIPFGGSYEEYNARNEEKLPQIVFFINNFDGVAEIYPLFHENLTSICRECTRYGIYFIVSLNGPSSMPRRATLCFKSRVCFHFTDPTQYSDAFDMRCRITPREMMGRGLINYDGGIHEFQTISLSDEDHTDSEMVHKLYEDIREKYTTSAVKIPELPECVTMDLVEKHIRNFDKIPIGVYRESLKTAYIDFSSFPFFVISSNKLNNMKGFAESLMMVLMKIPDCQVVFLDAQKLLPSVKDMCPSYYDDSFGALIDGLIKIEQDPEKKNQKYIYVFFGLDKMRTKLDSTARLDTFIEMIKKNDHSRLIMMESNKGIKSLDFDKWFMAARNAGDGLWVGQGFGAQQVFRISKVTNEMNASYPNNYAYLTYDSMPELIKLIEFTKIEEEDDDLDEE